MAFPAMITMKRIALISEHASPLALVGSIDSGGQNVYVGHVALQLAKRGHQVAVFSRLDHPAQAAVVDWAPNVRVIHVSAGPACFIRKEDMLQESGVQAQAIALDVGDPVAAQQAVDTTIQGFGKLDVLANNAGTDKTCSIEELSYSDWDRVIHINLSGPFLLSKICSAPYA